MEIQSAKVTVNKENTNKPIEKQGREKESSFLNALEKVVSKEKIVAQSGKNDGNISETDTNIKPATNEVSVQKEDSVKESSDLDSSMQSIMSMLQKFIGGKIDLETLIKGISEEVKGTVEQKDIVDLNALLTKSNTGSIKQLPLELMKDLKILGQNESLSKELESIIMAGVKDYIKTVKSDVISKPGTIEDKIRTEISTIVLKALSESQVKLTNVSQVVKVTNVSEDVKVTNIINEIKVVDNKGNVKEIQKTENIVSSFNESVNDTNKVATENAEGKQVTFQKNSMSAEDKILKSIIAPEREPGDKENIIAKTTNFISQFEAIRNEKITPDAIVINKSNFSEDIVKSVKFMQLNNLKDLTVTIAPKELGEVIIKLTMSGGIMKASITATNKEAYNILNSNLTDITSKLNTLDMKIQDFTLNIYNGDTTFFKQGSSGENSKEQNNKNPKNVLEEIEGSPLNSDIDVNSPNNVNILA